MTHSEAAFQTRIFCAMTSMEFVSTFWNQLLKKKKLYIHLSLRCVLAHSRSLLTSLSPRFIISFSLLSSNDHLQVVIGTTFDHFLFPKAERCCCCWYCPRLCSHDIRMLPNNSPGLSIISLNHSWHGRNQRYWSEVLFTSGKKVYSIQVNYGSMHNVLVLNLPLLFKVFKYTPFTASEHWAIWKK